METISGIPFAEVEFDRQGRLVDASQVERLKQFLVDQQISDLLVFCHGWNNDMQEARSIYYTNWLAGIAARREAGSGRGLPGRALCAVGLYWPSKKFADRDLIPGGAAGVGGELEAEELKRFIDHVEPLFDAPGAADRLDEAKALVDDLEDRSEARSAFFRAVRDALGPRDQLDAEDVEEIPDPFFEVDDREEIEELFEELEKPDPAHLSTLSTTGGAAGISFHGARAAARRLLNYITYYQMKNRARSIGAGGVADLLTQLRAARPDVRLHLIGHSFGGLLMTAAAWGGASASPAIPVDTLTLLQAAFSHNGFARDFHNGKDGRYRRVLTGNRVRGPILVSHTRNDTAVGVAYALASRFSREDAAALGLGGPGDRFGGIGANGAQATPEARQLDMLADQPYSFAAGTLYNLLADEFVTGHSDVTGSSVAHAILEAVASVD